MKQLLIALFFISMGLNAQNFLKFDKRNVECEDKWVAYPMEKDSTYTFGFIYIDSQAGLTLNYEGKFKIDKNGKFKRTEPVNKTSSLKVRLQPNPVSIAEIHEEKFKELEIEKVPSWLEIYKSDPNSIERLYRWGFLYNEYGEFQKALTYLDKAEKTDPNFKGLQTELAFSYNALEQFDKAAIALEKEIKNNPKDCYTLKELAYTYNHLGVLEKSIKTYNTMVSICSEKTFIQETAYNLAFRYFQKKDKKNFDKWDKETRKWADKETTYSKNLTQMAIDINK